MGFCLPRESVQDAMMEKTFLKFVLLLINQEHNYGKSIDCLLFVGFLPDIKMSDILTSCSIAPPK